MGVFRKVSAAFSMNDAGKVKVLSEAQLAKAILPNSSTADDNFTLFSALQPLKAFARISFIWQSSLKFTVSMLVHSKKAAVPM